MKSKFPLVKNYSLFRNTVIIPLKQGCAISNLRVLSLMLCNNVIELVAINKSQNKIKGSRFPAEGGAKRWDCILHELLERSNWHFGSDHGSYNP